MRTGNPAVGVNLARPSGWLFSSNKAASIVRGRRLAFKCRERHGRECAKRFFACGLDAKKVHLRHRQRAAGAGDFANSLELGRFGRGEEIDLVFGGEHVLPAFDQRRGRAGARRIRDGADQPAVKIAVLLRQFGAKIGDDHAAAGCDVFDPGIDMA